LGQYAPLQRGVGGARSADVAKHLPELALRHTPSAVLMFAGTNDLADGRTVQSVVDNVRCVMQQLHSAQPGTKLFYAGITPTPSRWSIWADQDAVNQAIQSLAAQHPSIVYIDTVSALLATGSPPDEAYFVDGLHLNAAGYALWDAAVTAVAFAGSAFLSALGLFQILAWKFAPAARMIDVRRTHDSDPDERPSIEDWSTRS